MHPQFAPESRLVCHRCSYEWMPRRGQPPKRCPRCRSVKWNNPDLKVTCVRCGHTWNSHDGKPKRCPSCGSHQWNVPLRSYRCLRCGASWDSKSSHMPKRCPSCGTRLWDIEPEVVIPPREMSMLMEDDVMREYRRGRGCLDISLSMDIPYSVVRGIIHRRSPGTEPRVRSRIKFHDAPVESDGAHPFF